MPTVGVCLSGCGFLDGAEIFESVATLYHLERAGAQALAMAPNIDQAHVVNHLTGEVVEGELVEFDRASGRLRVRLADGQQKQIAFDRVDEINLREPAPSD